MSLFLPHMLTFGVQLSNSTMLPRSTLTALLLANTVGFTAWEHSSLLVLAHREQHSQITVHTHKHRQAIPTHIGGGLTLLELSYMMKWTSGS